MVPMSQDMAIEKWMQGHSLIRSVGRFFAAGRRDDLLKNKNDGGWSSDQLENQEPTGLKISNLECVPMCSYVFL